MTCARLALNPPPFIHQRRYTGRRAQGVAYERKVQQLLLDNYPDTYVPSPWLCFQSEGSNKWRWCQPDGLLVDIDAGIITCVEVKYSQVVTEDLLHVRGQI